MLTSRCIQLKLWQELRSSCKWVIPNYTPDKWFESDIWAITKSGFSREYEIKLSLPDFLKDSQKFQVFSLKGKQKRKSWAASPLCKSVYKYDLLSAGNINGPSNFYYVTPEGLVPPEMIPLWAGWVEVRECKKSLRFIQKKAGPRLHKEKVSIDLDPKFLITFYYRYCNEAEKRHEIYDRRNKK